MKRLSMASLFLMACTSGGGGGGIRLDSGTGPDLRGAQGPDLAMAPKPDMAMPQNNPDLAMNGGMCSAMDNYGALGAKKGSAGSQMDMSGNQIIGWQAPIDNQKLPTLISLELYGGAGAFMSSKTIKTGTYQIAGDELNYATCGVCVLLYTGYDAQAMTIMDSYMATGGTVKLTSVNGTLTGTITGVNFEHVQIDQMTYESTPDPDGCMSQVSSVSFSDPIM